MKYLVIFVIQLWGSSRCETLLIPFDSKVDADNAIQFSRKNNSQTILVSYVALYNSECFSNEENEKEEGET